ncbi:hypothetical protein SGCZBJ_17585 [Caulobacter zeae]|uniref:Uncharacterized protein n=1 Tax=Caulobacter zeae TaxID=2055137 RepID=A0A2N5D9Y6_9CAUL|nr:2OG-Fe(II) oxygenase family protein [Caulobacter zeae]PLR22859.1 hypothetical protein SGCZBJ_17585 [Caulobacter zeae]
MNQGLVQQAWDLLGRGQAEQAVALTAAGAARPTAMPGLLIVHAAALKGVGRHAEALPFNERAARGAPQDRLAWYNLAATNGDLGRQAEAEAAVRKAIALGLEAPEARLVLARAVQFQHRYDEAEAIFQDAIARRPNFVDAHRDLAQLRWMRTADLDHALSPLKAALARQSDPRLLHVQALVEEFAGRLPQALDTLRLGLRRHPSDLHLLVTASHAAAELGETAEGLAHAQTAARLAPGAAPVLKSLAEALLAAGDAAGASSVAGSVLQAFPYDQHALSLQALAWRILGDPRYSALYDYDAFVRPYTLPTPEGWSDLESFLADLRRRLGELHDLETHPLQQSLRGGAQVQSLHTSREPIFQAFFASARATVERYAAEIGEGGDPLRIRRTGKAVVQGGWSVSLKPNGFHTDHVHPQGWVSSAFYIDLPPGVDDEGKREGWIKFGQPGCATAPKLAAEHAVKPAPGTLVLFPSYMWHGTVPFSGDTRRLTMAFDAVPG